MTDTLMIATAHGRRLNKTVKLDENGEIKVDPYDQARWFDYNTLPVTDLSDLHRVLLAVQRDQHSAVISGKLTEGRTSAKGLRRLLNDMDGVRATIEPERHHWLCIDVDKWHYPEWATDNVQAMDYYITTVLPPEFHGVSYIVQWSSKQGLAPWAGQLNGHVFFWMQEPRSAESLNDWGKWVNHMTGSKVIDTMIYSPNQLIYTAAPAFCGVADPLAERIQFIEREFPSVNFQPAPAKWWANKKKPSRDGLVVGAGYPTSGSGWRRFLARIGDDKDGFHIPIRDCIASYIRSTGHLAYDADFIKAVIREAAEAAICDPGRDLTQSVSDEKLDGLIEGAVAKYGEARSSHTPSSLPASYAVRSCYPPFLASEQESQSNSYALLSEEGQNHVAGGEEGGGEEEVKSPPAGWDDKELGLPGLDTISFMRVELFDNGSQKGRARFTAKLNWTRQWEPGLIDTSTLKSRFVDFTTPARFKRTMLNHVNPDNKIAAAWYEAVRQHAMSLKKADADLEEVLIGHVQYHWIRGNGASKYYRYDRQVALIAFHKDGTQKIVILRQDESLLVEGGFSRAQRDAKAAVNQRAPAKAGASIHVFYHDKANYFRHRKVIRDTARKTVRSAAKTDGEAVLKAVEPPLTVLPDDDPDEDTAAQEAISNSFTDPRDSREAA